MQETKLLYLKGRAIENTLSYWKTQASQPRTLEDSRRRYVERLLGNTRARILYNGTLDEMRYYLTCTSTFNDFCFTKQNYVFNTSQLRYTLNNIELSAESYNSFLPYLLIGLLNNESGYHSLQGIKRLIEIDLNIQLNTSDLHRISMSVPNSYFVNHTGLTYYTVPVAPVAPSHHQCPFQMNQENSAKILTQSASSSSTSQRTGLSNIESIKPPQIPPPPPPKITKEEFNKIPKTKPLSLDQYYTQLRYTNSRNDSQPHNIHRDDRAQSTRSLNPPLSSSSKPSLLSKHGCFNPVSTSSTSVRNAKPMPSPAKRSLGC